MAEADDGHAQTLTGLEGRMSGAVGVPRFDQVRLQGDEMLRPAASGGRPAIAVAEGQANGGDRIGASAVRAGSVAGHDKCVFDLGPVFRKPRALGEQVALYAPRARREQHGGVHQMRSLRAGPDGRISPGKMRRRVGEAAVRGSLVVITPLQNQAGPPSSKL